MQNQYVNIKIIAFEVTSGLSCDYSIVIQLIGEDDLNNNSTALNSKNAFNIDIPCPDDPKAKEWSYIVPKNIYNELLY